ncbi:hypothetical protein, unlikely [Trypanosoma brucei brucei TREU927]|uniref:Uncharacterized protein n=1 Tax=Trypanosoma brucei brucei (strain 927/4 GUTat10.1) TaxID=185431 RepID=Q8IFJ0_TRYB2|nr:hypothetical protein, unlikely [Trypanosoma brucei brucei TREU927]CAD53014.1 hypothetical protein, unlikely [Trypanosoma brucei brucei TREU927]
MDFFCIFYDGNCRNIEGITEVRSGMLKKNKKKEKEHNTVNSYIATKRISFFLSEHRTMPNDIVEYYTNISGSVTLI